MKKNLFILFILICGGVAEISAQKGFTLRVAGGYAWPGFMKTEGIMGPKIDPYTPEVDALVPLANLNYFTDSAKSYQPVRGSYGQGMNFAFAFGYNINPYVGFEMGVSFLQSKDINARQDYELVYQPYQGAQFSHSGYHMTADVTTKAFGVSMMPSINIQAAKPGWKVYPYARLGLTLPVFGNLTHNIKVNVQDSVFIVAPTVAAILDTAPYFIGHHTDVKLKTEGTVSLGINGAIGIAYKALPYMSIFAEVNGQYLVTRAKSSKITQWDADGKSKLDERGKYRTEFNFVDKIDAGSNNGDYHKDSNGNAKFDPKKPKDDIRPFGPFSNLGINIGVSFVLSKETLTTKKKKEEGKGK